MHAMESWLSGRKRFTANEVNCQRFQGFESLTLRIDSVVSERPETLVNKGFLFSILI